MTSSTKTRTRISAGLLAFATLSGVAIAAAPASAIEPDSPEGSIVLPNSSTGSINAQLRGFCHAKMLTDPVETGFEIVKKDTAGVPIEGVEFEIEFQPNAASSNAISLDSWQAVRSPELETARVDAEAAMSAADSEYRTYFRDIYSPASNALSRAQGDLSAAQDVRDRNPTPENEAAVVEAEAAATEAQAAVDEVKPELDRLKGVFDASQTAAVAAAQAIADHLMSEAEIDAFTVTTDSEGRISLPTYYCGGAGDGSGDRWVITETGVPAGVDPAGVGSELVVSTGYGNHAEQAISGVDGGVYTQAVFTQESAHSGTWSVDAVNELLPEEPDPTPTPEEPTPTPEEPTPTPTAPTPVKEVKVTPSSPIQPPLVSG